MYFPIWKSIYSNLHFNNTKAKLFRSIVDEYYKPLHMKFFKIMYIYSQSKSFALLPSFKLETIVGFVTKQRHTSRFLTEFTSCNGKMPCYSLPCWEISWPDEVHHFLASHQKSKGDHSYSFQQINGGSKLCFSERHQDILSCNPLSFLTQNIKSVVCRFSLDS